MSASGTVSEKLPLASVTAPRVLSPTSVTATPASGVSDESLTTPVIVRCRAGDLRAGIRAIWRSVMVKFSPVGASISFKAAEIGIRFALRLTRWERSVCLAS